MCFDTVGWVTGWTSDL